MNVVELTVAGVFALFGVRSLTRWLGREFPARSPRERLLYVLHITARVAMWFGLAGLFVGYAFVEEPQKLSWYLLLLISLAGIQLLTSFFLWRTPTASEERSPSDRAEPGPGGIATSSSGNGSKVSSGEHRPGPLREEKQGETSDPGHRQPEAAEVESARLLANQARQALLAKGLSNAEIGRLADDYVAQDRGEGLEEFIEWAARQVPREPA